MMFVPVMIDSALPSKAADSLLLQGMPPDDRAYSLLLAQADSHSIWLYLLVALLAQWVAGSLYVGMRGLTAAILPRIALISLAGVSLQLIAAPMDIIAFSLAFATEGVLLWLWCRRLCSLPDLATMTLTMVVAGFSLSGLASACFLIY